MDPLAFGRILREYILRSKPGITLLPIGIIFISLTAFTGFCYSTGLAVYAQLLNDRDNDGMEDHLDLCPDDPLNSCDGSCANNIIPCPDGTFVTDCADQTQDQNASSIDPIQGQITNRECVLSSGTCTEADVLLDDNGDVICDSTLGSECSQYLDSTVQPNQDQTQDENPDTGSGSRGESQEPGTGTSIGEGSEEKEMMILKKLTDLAEVAENIDFGDSVMAFKTVLEQYLQTTSPKPPNLSIILEALKLWLDDPGFLWGASKDFLTM